MGRVRMSYVVGAAGVATLSLLLIPGPEVQAEDPILDCDANPDAVQEALDAALYGTPRRPGGREQPPANHVSVEFTGTCHSVVVEGIIAFIVGSGENPTIEGFVDVGAGAFAVLEGFNVSPLLFDDDGFLFHAGGVSVGGASSAVIDGIEIDNSEGQPGHSDVGIFVVDGSFALVLGAEINRGELFVLQKSWVRVRNSTLTGLGDLRAVTVIRDSSVRSQGGNYFSNPCLSVPPEGCASTVSVAQASSWFSTNGPPDVYEPPGIGENPSLRLSGSAHADVRQGRVGDAVVDLNSVLALSEGGFGDPSDITIHDITISRDSAVTIGSEEVNWTGEANCLDGESNLQLANESPHGDSRRGNCKAFGPGDSDHDLRYRRDDIDERRHWRLERVYDGDRHDRRFLPEDVRDGRDWPSRRR